jgi:hypothetical protein
MLYFAYGSNMCTGRLIRRVPSAKVVGVARLSNHALRFHNRGSDGSAKADAFFTGEPEDVVWGVLFTLDAAEEWRLDEAEGLGRGCSKTVITVDLRGGERPRAVMYAARRDYIEPSLRPYSWYKRFVLEGSREHSLPPDYIAPIEAIQAIDPDRDGDAAKLPAETSFD